MEPPLLPMFLDYLVSVHTRTRRIVMLIPPDDLEWAPASGKFSLGDTVRHLAALERFMYAETVHGRPSCYPGHARDLADGYDAVLAYYDRLHAESRVQFEALTETQMLGRSVTPAGASISTWKWLRLMLEHEAHHRGQLYLMLSLRGVTTPPIYGLTEEQVAGLSAPSAASVPAPAASSSASS